MKELIPDKSDRVSIQITGKQLTKNSSITWAVTNNSPPETGKIKDIFKINNSEYILRIEVKPNTVKWYSFSTNDKTVKVL